MPNIQALSRERHHNQSWLTNRSYRFVAHDAYLPLVQEELPLATMSLPIAFLPTAKGMQPIALTGVQPKQNLLVTSDGTWLYGYIPQACKHYPFCIGTTEKGEQVLCIDEDTELVIKTASDEAFFDPEGNPSAGTLERLELLKSYEQKKCETFKTTRILEEKKLFCPLVLGINIGNTINRIEGLYKISEESLSALPEDDLEQIRNTGGLTMIYCHHFSLQHWGKLQELAEARHQLADAIPSMLTGMGETLDFSGFR